MVYDVSFVASGACVRVSECASEKLFVTVIIYIYIKKKNSRWFPLRRKKRKKRKKVPAHVPTATGYIFADERM